jgi:uncharacterized protein (TIGR02145 family)
MKDIICICTIIKKPFRFYLLILTAALLIFTCRCKKEETYDLPEVSTNEVSYITPASAVCGGEVISEGSFPVTEKGVCWSTDNSPTVSVSGSKTLDGTGEGPFTSTIIGLTASTTYHVRAYATNNEGIAYGSEQSFTTTEDHTGETGTVTDIEGNVYQTIGIGSQIWMQENLKTIMFSDGSAIPLVEDSIEWALQYVEPAYCWYDNDEEKYKDTFGALYNFRTVMTGKLCPSGWHVPDDDEWTILETFLGGRDVAGGMMKEAGTEHWLSPNSGATNESDFTALPGGHRVYYSAPYGTGVGRYIDMGEKTIFWTSTLGNNNCAGWWGILSYSTELIRGGENILYGNSVRCIKD